jgi:predicted nuclease of predicted toxin-antitoxin system
MTKDASFVHLVEELGIPQQVILLACGNTSNAQLNQILKWRFRIDLDFDLLSHRPPNANLMLEYVWKLGETI